MRKQKSKKKFKFPNGFGSVYPLSGNRRKPWVAVVTVGMTDKGNCIRKVVGSAEDYESAMEMLFDYKRNPYDLDLKKLTFSDVANKVFIKLEKSVENGKMSASNLKNLKSVYYNQCQSIWKTNLVDLKIKEMQYIIDNSNLRYTTRGYIKNLCVKVFNEAIIEYELPINNNPAERLTIGEKEASTLHKPFDDKEYTILWNNTENDIVKLILIYLYTGARPNELIKIKKEKVFLKERYMIGGSKTKAGKNREIPICKKIYNLIEYFYNKNSEYLITINNQPLKYDKYLDLFKETLISLKIDHTPYDTRHSFSTKMKALNINEYIIKRIMGHSINDITEKIYTHRTIEELIKAVDML